MIARALFCAALLFFFWPLAVWFGWWALPPLGGILASWSFVEAAASHQTEKDRAQAEERRFRRYMG